MDLAVYNHYSRYSKVGFLELNSQCSICTASCNHMYLCTIPLHWFSWWHDKIIVFHEPDDVCLEVLRPPNQQKWWEIQFLERDIIFGVRYNFWRDIIFGEIYNFWSEIEFLERDRIFGVRYLLYIMKKSVLWFYHVEDILIWYKIFQN